MRRGKQRLDIDTTLIHGIKPLNISRRNISLSVPSRPRPPPLSQPSSAQPSPSHLSPAQPSHGERKAVIILRGVAVSARILGARLDNSRQQPRGSETR
ncbi:hypothetical protein E2C01_036244 [Portunus trituberculatus]|uniref:Uncharacterized protein n=1 Tax=Portunus trituberculatus TaxID=210409 RepID=A0A5B7F5B5_PORTR|nr:hypothetical protein [Portunus trituberculatus]